LSVASDSIPLLSQILARNPIRRTLVFRVSRVTAELPTQKADPVGFARTGAQ
jgi:hypothetical protein